MKQKLIIMCILLAVTLTACLPSVFQTGDDTSHTSDSEKELFNRFYSTDGEQADALFAQIIAAIESQDSETMKAFFAAYVIDAAEDIENDISSLFDFYEGEMTTYKRYGPGSHTTKEGSEYTKEIFASYDVTTTTGIYRIAINFCTVDYENANRMGLTSMYIMKAENSDMNFAYWGGDVWDAGIVIEYGAQPEEPSMP